MGNNELHGLRRTSVINGMDPPPKEIDDIIMSFELRHIQRNIRGGPKAGIFG